MHCNVFTLDAEVVGFGIWNCSWTSYVIGFYTSGWQIYHLIHKSIDVLVFETAAESVMS